MKKELFNRTALERLADTEGLDEPVKLMNLPMWILFAAILLGVAAAVLWMCVGTVSSGADYEGVIFDNEDVVLLNTEIGGVVQDVLVKEGDRVSDGDILAVIANEEQMEEIDRLRRKQETYGKETQEYLELEEEINRRVGQSLIRSTTDGIVQRAELSGTSVEAGALIASVIPSSPYGYQEILLYIPKEEANTLEIGMEAQVTPAYAAREEYGYMTGVVAGISENLATENGIIRHMGTLEYVEDLLPKTGCVEVKIHLGISEGAENSYIWSNRRGEGLSVKSGDKCRVHIVKSEYRPYELLLR